MERKYITCDAELSCILTLVHQTVAVSIAYRFCEDTPCISACLREALKMDEANNVIRIEKIRCIG